MLGRHAMPGTLKRSSSQAQRTWVSAYDRAVEMYGEGQHARWTAFAALKCEFEKARDHWEPRSHREPLVSVTSTRIREARCKNRSAGTKRARCGPELLYLAGKVGVERADELDRPEVVEAVRAKMGLAPRGPHMTSAEQPVTLHPGA